MLGWLLGIRETNRILRYFLAQNAGDQEKKLDALNAIRRELVEIKGSSEKIRSEFDDLKATVRSVETQLKSINDELDWTRGSSLADQLRSTFKWWDEKEFAGQLLRSIHACDKGVELDEILRTLRTVESELDQLNKRL